MMPLNFSINLFCNFLDKTFLMFTIGSSTVKKNGEKRCCRPYYCILLAQKKQISENCIHSKQVYRNNTANTGFFLRVTHCSDLIKFVTVKA